MKDRNRTAIIGTINSDPKGICNVLISEDDGLTSTIIHTVDRVNYGKAIAGIMQEWGCKGLRYTPRALRKFITDSSCNPSTFEVQ